MKLIPQAVSRTVGRQTLQLSAASPKLLFAVGLVGFGATVVLAAKATLRLEEEVLFPAEKHLVDLQMLTHENYTEKDRLHDKTLVYVDSALKITKLYAPAIVVGVISVGCLTKSHNILTKRNAGLTAAYAALEKGFNQYRERVVSEYGEQKDKELLYGVVEREIVEETKNGPVVKTVRGPADVSVYAKFFDELNPNWQPNPEWNMIYLKAQETYFNNRLHAIGHVFLNEVYDHLAIERTQAGQEVGWFLSPEGDNYVEFGLYDGTRSKVRDFVNGFEGAILLDFNVDGIIHSKLKTT